MAHGVYLRNSNGMDVVLEANSLTYHTIGGVLDFLFLPGPLTRGGRAAVSRGHRSTPHAPLLGSRVPQLSLWLYPNVAALEAVVASYASAKVKMHTRIESVDVFIHNCILQIPLETMWTDIDYMDQVILHTPHFHTPYP